MSDPLFSLTDWRGGYYVGGAMGAPSNEGSRQLIGVVGTVVGIGAIAGSAYSATATARSIVTLARSPVLGSIAISGHRLSTAARGLLLTKKLYRYAAFGLWVYNPLATFNYIRDGEYTKAAISFYGPAGSVYLYNHIIEDDLVSERQPYAQKRVSTNLSKSKSSKKKGKSSQRRSTGRPPWCQRHRTYHYC